MTTRAYGQPRAYNNPGNTGVAQGKPVHADGEVRSFHSPAAKVQRCTHVKRNGERCKGRPQFDGLCIGHRVRGNGDDS